MNRRREKNCVVHATYYKNDELTFGDLHFCTFSPPPSPLQWENHTVVRLGSWRSSRNRADNRFECKGL